MLNYRRTTPRKIPDIKERKAYFVGGGIASLAGAVFLIRDAKMPGKNIYIIEKTPVNGGCLDGSGTPENGYLLRGGRMFEEHYEATWDLLGSIPSLDDPEKTILDEVVEFNKEYVGSSKCRLVGTPGKKVDFSKYGLTVRHLNEMNELILTPEEKLAGITIEQWFSKDFFETNFWYFWATMFAFQPWHSVAEMRRYMLRFMHLVPGMNRIEGVKRTPYNQYDSIILPIQKWLQERGVNFIMGTTVVDVEIEERDGTKYVTKLHLKGQHGGTIEVNPKDLVFITLGSMVDNSTYGDFNHPPVLNRGEGDSWRLWRKLVEKDPALGNPDAFASDIDKTKWESFTITFRGDRFLKMLEEFTGNRTGTGGLVTFKDSSWLMSIVAFRQPHFRNQPDDVTVLWGYGLFVDKPGDYIKKPMSQATGKEIFLELLYHLGWLDRKDELLETVINVRTAMMPYITAHFMPRKPGDRPPVVPENYGNLALLGQYVEIPGECVFTVEYSVKSAMIGVYTLLDLGREAPPAYTPYQEIPVLLKAAETLVDDDKKELLKYSLSLFLSGKL
ncbi:oleate hydratase [Thermococcus camini]|uniref:Oleate hydratase n=1 Tax=Thermococcus camini TaxID=2016373 RepID=A0A7G2DAS9_9EURY|nr:oleate hydratase [Thermococcus camini]CAD5244217.1 Oleate hydratase [Thermococcus camini]